ncbi:MAG: hypothetical protein ACXWLX_05465 [Rhizomicrobium sp.]
MGLAKFVTKTAKGWIRHTIGLWPAMELRNRIVMARSLPGIIRFENEEVAHRGGVVLDQHA